jgi:DNA polymerase-3 subunit epsilon
MNDMDWIARGFSNFKQELLCIWHGFYYDSHRAMNDVDALIHLLTHDVYSKNKPLCELIENSMIPYYKISALKSPFETKDKLKARNYNWDSKRKCWWKKISPEEVDSEKDWLSVEIYSGIFRGRIEKIALIDKYKD